MKKFLVMLLCAAMLICMASVVSAVEVKTDRSIEAVASDAVVYAGDTVEVTVAIYGDDLVNAEWTLSYNPTYFDYVGATSDIGATSVANGSAIKAYHFVTDKDVVYTNGQVLAVYKFTAKAQSTVVTGAFELSNTAAYTYMESIAPDATFEASNEGTEVTIDLIPYDVEKIFGNADKEFEHDGEQVEVPYNDAEHYFQVKAYDSRDGEESTGATITYKLVSFSEYNPDEASLLTDLVVGEEVTSIDDLKKQGTYVIEYYVSPEIGYAGLEGDFTVNIVRPEFEIEVNLAADNSDYVNGKKIVLVYTDTDNVYFEFDGNTMLDVTASGYKFEDTTYYHVFAFVTDAIDGGTLDDYAALIKNIYDDSDVVTVDYSDSTDLNLDGDVTIRDVSVAYGVYNQVAEYYADAQWQKNILKADITHSKNVDNDDITLVIADAFM